jgi:hypothetical protein
VFGGLRLKFEKVPLGHTAQELTLAPVTVLAVPSAHGLHRQAPASLKKPAPHFMHMASLGAPR